MFGKRGSRSDGGTPPIGARMLAMPRPRYPSVHKPKGVPDSHPLLVEARPLILSRARAVISWTPKAACTQVVMWFLHLEGLLDAALYYRPWPHDFRGDVYYNSAVYHRRARELAEARARGYTLIRITRDPVARLVSIYRHALRTGFHAPELDAALGRDTRATGVSMEDFGTSLIGRNLYSPSEVNMHLLAQTHPIWDLPFDRVITLNADDCDLSAGLNLIAQDLGLAQTDFAGIPAFGRIAARHNAPDNGAAADPQRFHMPLNNAMGEAFPKSALRSDPRVVSLAETLHGRDFGAVDSHDSAGRLHFPHRRRRI